MNFFRSNGWKLSYSISIHKSVSAMQIFVCRDVFISRSIAQTFFEGIISEYLFVLCRKSIIRKQLGFSKDRSAGTNLLLFTFIYNLLELRHRLDYIVVDWISL